MAVTPEGASATERPRIELLRVDRLDCALEAHDWDFDSRRRDEIDAHWAKLVAAKPLLYDGRMFLARRIEAEIDAARRRVFSVSFFAMRFSRFLAWRDFGFPDRTVYNCFSMAAVRSADGAFLLGEMAAHTANAGAKYFPSGTPDPSDVTPTGAVDLDGSLERELMEETGISIKEMRPRDGWTIVLAGQRAACVKVLASAEPASALEARVQRFLAAETLPELAKPHMIARRAQLSDPHIPDFIRVFLDDELSD